MRKAMTSSMCGVMMSLLLCFLLLEPTQALKQSYIVYLGGSHSFGDENPSSFDADSITNSHYDLLASYLGSIEKAKEVMFYSYNRYINGFAAILDEEEAIKITKHPKVLSIFLNKGRELHTTHSWSFLGLERNNSKIPKGSIWSKSIGEDIIIGNLDTGVWPESKSLSDEDLGPIPKRWHGICQNSDKFHCNRKLIGARYFNKGYLAAIGQATPNVSFHSVRDYEGHGSHTLSTAGGNFVPGASVFGNGNGTASGGSPKARVAAYKVCWPPISGGDGCYDADILAGFEAAISDGVDVISISLGSNEPSEFVESAISIGSFHAVAHGIVVVCSAGNNGPNSTTVSNMEPWVITVAASSIDREFNSYVMLGNKKILKGTSLSQYSLSSTKFYPLISAADAKANNATEINALRCLGGALDPKKTKGKILVCVRGENDRVENGFEAARVGAIGMILANDVDSGDDIVSDPHVLLASHVNFINGTYILSYINHTKFPMAYISVKTELGKKPSPFVASFSSRGPSILEPSILKSDIIAPGVNIITTYSEVISPTDLAYDKRRTPFMIMSGTSMSCPHVSGLVGILKSLHLDWSPAAIKSAIMTTTRIRDNTRKPMLDSSTLEKATPFAYGAGHIQPHRATDPGLIYDLDTTDYLNFLCGHGYYSSEIKVFYNKTYTCPKSFNLANFNYPSITILHFDNGNSQNVTRTITNVGFPSTYKVRIKVSPEFTVSVEPSILSFKKKGEKKMFRVTLTLKKLRKYKGDYFFGGLDWTDGKHHVSSPIVVKYPY